MCGFLVLKSNKISKNTKKSFLNSLDFLKRRGPDETKVLEKKNYLIGFTRLSINDLKTASQPYVSNCQNYIIVFNGEIINYRHLALHLEDNGINIKHGHEAEVIINLYKLYGNNVVKYLRGFFSFVIINTKTNKVFSAVDRYSIKPLYYSKNLNNQKNSFLLTSDYSAVLRGGLIKKKINYNKFIDYFVMTRDFDSTTIISNVNKLKSASTLDIEKKFKISTYWKPFTRRINFNKSKKKLLSELDYHLKAVANDWKIADTKLSLSLSAGVDSQLIKTYFHENKILTKNFHLVETKKNNEIIKNSIKIKNNVKKIIQLINNITKENFNPFALGQASSTTFLQIYDLIAKKNYRVTFCGEGADELFGGYSKYKKQLKIIKNKKISFADSYIKLHQNEINNFSYVLKDKKFKSNKILKKKISSIKLSSKKVENKILEFDQLTWIPALIQRHDVIGMYNGLEVRPPFLDHKLTEFVNNLHPRYKLNLTTKTESMLYDLFYQKTEKKFPYKKKGTPSAFELILKDKDELNSFKKSINCKDLSKFFDISRMNKLIDHPKTSRIFLWRLYIISKMLNNF